MDSRDFCLDGLTGDLGTPQCLPKLALEIKHGKGHARKHADAGGSEIKDGGLTIRQESVDH